MEFEQSFLDHDGERLGLQIYPDPDRAEEVGARPARADAPAVLIWPAMGVPARYYRPFAGMLRAEGLAVVVADLRGTGASTPKPSRRSRYGYADLAGDVGAVLDHLKSRLDGRTVVLLGHSLGGQAGAIHLAMTAGDGERPGGVDGLALVGVGLPWFRSYPGRRGRQVLVFTQGIATATAVLRVWPGWGFGGRQSRGVIRDWGFTARHGRFPRLNGVDVEDGLTRVRTPVLAISLAGDWHTPAPTLDQLCGKLSAAPVERVHLGTQETGTALDHFSWVRASSPIATRVAAFAHGLRQAHNRT